MLVLAVLAGVLVSVHKSEQQLTVLPQLAVATVICLIVCLGLVQAVAVEELTHQILVLLWVLVAITVVQVSVVHFQAVVVAVQVLLVALVAVQMVVLAVLV
jgi:hypothetical protein